MLHGNGEQLRPGGGWSKIGTLERPGRHESRCKRPFSIEANGPHQYDGGLRSDKWEIPAQRAFSENGIAPRPLVALRLKERLFLTGFEHEGQER